MHRTRRPCAAFRGQTDLCGGNNRATGGVGLPLPHLIGTVVTTESWARFYGSFRNPPHPPSHGVAAALFDRTDSLAFAKAASTLLRRDGSNSSFFSSFCRICSAAISSCFCASSGAAVFR